MVIYYYYYIIISYYYIITIIYCYYYFLLIVKVFGDCRKLFQRDAPDSDARFHHSTMLPDFPRYHGTKKIIFPSEFTTKEN